MSNMPGVPYLSANMIINAFRESNEVFTISPLTSPTRLKFPSIRNHEGANQRDLLFPHL